MSYGLSAAKQMPSQKKTDAQKTEEWFKECVDAGESMILFQNEGIRQSRINKKVNYNLYSGILDNADVERIMNPNQIRNATFPATVKNYPLTNPKIKALLGEELKRRFDWRVSVINEDAISSKQEAQKDYVMKVLQEIIQKEIELEGGLSEEEIQQRLQEAQKYVDYDLRDLRELTATRLLEYYTRYLDTKTVFNKGFEDAIIAGEEVYCIDEVNLEPLLRKCNPLNTYFLTSPDNQRVDDCDMIVEEHYIPLGTVIDRYYDYLTPKDIEILESRRMYINADSNNIVNYGPAPVFTIDSDLINTDMLYANQYGGDFDNNGNVRVVKISWRGMRKIGILTSYDEGGNIVKTDVHPDYKPDTSKGEEIRFLWIGEFHEGTKIANKIYVKMQVKPVQFRKLMNKSYCASGYIGTIYNTNSSKVQSLFDIMKPYQYTYNAYMYRTELAMIKAVGKIGKLDLAEIPDGWDTDMALHYAINMGWMVTDSFKEGKKGAALGKLVGTQTSGKGNVIDLEQGQFIQQNLGMLAYLESQLDNITGISKQRQGQVSPDMGLGVMQQAQQASATITETYFYMHESTKLRVLATLLEVAKYCFKNGNKKFQYILDDMSQVIFDVDGQQFNEAEYGIITSNAINDADTINMLKEATKIALQTGAVDILQMMDVYSNESTSAIKRKLQKSIKEKQMMVAQQQQTEAKEAQAERDHTYMIEQESFDLERYKTDANNETKIRLEEMKSLGIDEGSNTADIVAAADSALKAQELAHNQFLAANKHASEVQTKQQEIQIKKEESKNKMEIENKKLEEIKLQSKNQIELANKKAELEKKAQASKERIEQAKLKIAARKAKSTTKK